MIAPGGVDMRTGRYVYSQTDLSVGQGESLFELKRIMKALVRGHIDPFGNFSHNWDISLSEKRVNIDQHSFDHGSGTDFRINVNYGGLTETFQSRSIHTGFTPLSTGPRPSLTYTGDRASATALYTFTAADGTIVNFRAIGSADCSSWLRCAYVSAITRPDGTTLSFDYHYDAALPNNRARLRRVTSSRGYVLILEGSPGAVTKACIINQAIRPAPTGDACPADALQAASYAYDAGRLTSVSVAGAGTETFVYGLESGNATMAFTKPGQSTPWLTNILFPTLNEEEVWEAVSEQRFATGERYYYSFHNPPALTDQSETIVGGSYSNALGETTTIRFGFPQRPEDCGFQCDPVRDRTDIVLQQTPVRSR
jgi:hypothetical protein